MKKIAILPTLLTLGNAVCGFAAIVWFSWATTVVNGVVHYDYSYFAAGGWFILAAMVFDAFDGYVARLSKAASNFGGQLDSLCDAISFGVAPAFLILRLSSLGDREQVKYLIAVVAGLYMICALVRLARFNVENTPDPESHRRFRGLPSPAAAGCVASLGILCDMPTDHLGWLYSDWFQFDLDRVRATVRYVIPFGGFLVAFLMVSQAPFPHLTNQVLRGRKSFRWLRYVLLAAFTLVLLRQLVLVPVFWGYALIFAARHVVLRLLRRAGPAPSPSPTAEASSPEPKWPPDVHRVG